MLETTGITATAGIGTNLFLCKVAMDIVAKHIPADKNGVQMCIRDRIDLMKQDYDVVQLSAAMGTNINLMLIKLNELNRMGWQLNLRCV